MPTINLNKRTMFSWNKKKIELGFELKSHQFANNVLQRFDWTVSSSSETEEEILADEISYVVSDKSVDVTGVGSVADPRDSETTTNHNTSVSGINLLDETNHQQ
uniref:Uncharacterized protein n=1 Tax=Clytia hemisphaerica TaxID=252671 RepID=A0A7M5WVF4_9CNID